MQKYKDRTKPVQIQQELQRQALVIPKLAARSDACSEDLFAANRNKLLFLLSQTLTLMDGITDKQTNNYQHLNYLEARHSQYIENNKIKTEIASKNDPLDSVLMHLDQLEKRILDPRARIMVVGDLNSGKSTVTNRLINQKIVPVKLHYNLGGPAAVHVSICAVTKFTREFKLPGSARNLGFGKVQPK